MPTALVVHRTYFTWASCLQRALHRRDVVGVTAGVRVLREATGEKHPSLCVGKSSPAGATGEARAPGTRSFDAVPSSNVASLRGDRCWASLQAAGRATAFSRRKPAPRAAAVVCWRVDGSGHGIKVTRDSFSECNAPLCLFYGLLFCSSPCRFRPPAGLDGG